MVIDNLQLMHWGTSLPAQRMKAFLSVICGEAESASSQADVTPAGLSVLHPPLCDQSACIWGIEQAKGLTALPDCNSVARF